jgi:hypothetical protein
MTSREICLPQPETTFRDYSVCSSCGITPNQYGCCLCVKRCDYCGEQEATIHSHGDFICKECEAE